jgi:AbrB family looped-hinge helix DNA binding protein
MSKVALTNSDEAYVRINGKGALVIPATLRRALGIEPGDRLLMRIQDGELRVTTLRQRVAKAQQILRKYVPRSVSLVDELIAERRAAARHE